jgi:5'-3' exonuclease
MGIPSFYKHLIQSITGLTSKDRVPPKALCLDLNCAIYHCVKKLQKRTPYTESNRIKWEADLISQVIAYIKQLDAYVKPTETLYVGVDGVAPMAKIKQQRARRFKSAHAAEEEGRIRAEAQGTPYTPAPRWDTNAVTPGTKFMTALANALRAYAKTNPRRIIVSPADEPGEGEQKIMAWVRATKPTDIVVYGLDADLIVLSLWATASEHVRVDLFREEVEFAGGGVKEDALGEEQFLYLDMNHLASTLFSAYGKPEQTQDTFVQDFVALMNLLGNDFVPHGMALKIKDEGIETLLNHYRGMTTPLLNHAQTGVQYVPETLTSLFKILAADEDRAIHRAIKKKAEARIGSTPSKDPVDQALSRYNDTPVLMAAESPLVHRIHVPGQERPVLMLRPDWRIHYDALALLGADPEKAAHKYLESLGWTLAYYSGAQTDMNWYYPWLCPPRYETITAVCATLSRIPVPATQQPALKPTEQLAMVLPESSFNLLPAEYAALPRKYPYAWPQSWDIYSFGRRFLWECEPLVPLIQPSQIKEWIEELYD